MKLFNIYFSAKGTTEICAHYIWQKMNIETELHNWFRNPCNDKLEISSKDALLFSMPVYGGYIPKHCVEMVKNLKGHNTPAIIVAVYGNRHYDNALLQMKDILTEQGFNIVAAGAFIAEHSVFPNVASGRPDYEDKKAMEEFAKKCSQILNSPKIKKHRVLNLPGEMEYNSHYAGLPFKPSADEKCIDCGECARICPKKAIDINNIKVTNGDLCIGCGACIKICPVGARNYHSEAYEQVRDDFEKMCLEYRAPELFYVEEAE